MPASRPRLSYERLREIESGAAFQVSVVTIIILSALSTGAKTFEPPGRTGTLLDVLDWAITGFFLVEISLRFAVHGDKRRFFADGWNTFDTLIVVGSLIPLPNSEAVLIGRLLRVFRVLRLISVVPDLRFLVVSLVRAVRKLGYIVVLMFIIFYIYGAIGSLFFARINEELWGDVAISMLTLFRVATFEDWTDVMYETMDVYPISWVYYLTFIFLVAFVFLNMMIGVVLDVMTADQNAEAEAHADASRADLADQIRAVEAKVDRLLAAQEASGSPPGQT